MIESISSQEDELQLNRISPIKMPKNIRQIGQIEGNKRVYVEDYVMTFIRQLSVKNVGKYHVIVLLGKYVRIDETKNILVSGAVDVKDISFEESMTFTNEAWTSIYEDVKKYFTDVEIVGWVLARAGLPLQLDDRIIKIHLDNFAGQDKTLFLYDSMDKEEAFYLYDGNYLKQQTGYYIYYEKNDEMQTYMIDQKGTVSEESGYEDRAIKEIRTIIASKKEIPQEKKLMHLFYGASTVLAAVVLVIGVTMLNNYDKMRNMEETLNTISENLGDKIKNESKEGTKVNEKATEDEDTIDIDTMVGKVTTIKEEDVVSVPDQEDTEEATEAIQDSVEDAKVYIVKKGDTLASISNKVYKSTKYIKKIMKANDIEDQDKIYAGQKLIIP